MAKKAKYTVKYNIWLVREKKLYMSGTTWVIINDSKVDQRGTACRSFRQDFGEEQRRPSCLVRVDLGSLEDRAFHRGLFDLVVLVCHQPLRKLYKFGFTIINYR